MSCEIKLGTQLSCFPWGGESPSKTKRGFDLPDPSFFFFPFNLTIPPSLTPSAPPIVLFLIPTPYFIKTGGGYQVQGKVTGGPWLRPLLATRSVSRAPISSPKQQGFRSSGGKPCPSEIAEPSLSPLAPLKTAKFYSGSKFSSASSNNTASALRRHVHVRRKA